MIIVYSVLIMDCFMNELTDSQLIEAMEDYELCEALDAYERGLEPMEVDEDSFDLPMEIEEDSLDLSMEMDDTARQPKRG